MNIYKSIFTHKKTSKDIWENGIHTLQDGRNILCQFFISMELQPFYYYFVFTKTLIWSKEKCKQVYLNQYQPRKIPQALQEQDIHPLQHWILFGIISRYFQMSRQFSLSLGFRFSSFIFLSIFPATTGYISVTNTWVKNTPWHYLHR